MVFTKWLSVPFVFCLFVHLFFFFLEIALLILIQIGEYGSTPYIGYTLACMLRNLERTIIELNLNQNKRNTELI